MNEVADRKHSPFGIVSFLIGLLNLGYTGNLIFDWFNIVNDLASMGPGAIFGLFFIPVLFLLIPAIVNTSGIGLGVTGLFDTDRKRLSAFIGLTMNVAALGILVTSFLLYAIK